MILKELILTNYRNYKKLNLSLRPGINLISGDNAQGKTNLLESIYYLGTLKSFRVRQESELIRWEQNMAGIEANFVRPNGTDSHIEIHWAKGLRGQWERRIKCNGLILNSLAKILGEVPIALFFPQDLTLVQGGPEERRRYLDVLLCKSSPSYLRHLIRYRQVLKQRNEWWRTRGSYQHWNELEVWDEQLAHLASKLVEQRAEAISLLASMVREILKKLGDGISFKLDFNYRSNVEGSPTEIISALRSKREQELERRLTLCGPHRDDIDFLLEGHSFRRCASQGQHRSLALALRLAEALYIGNKTKNPAIVLLDDCFSELDGGRCRHLFDYLENFAQVIITSANSLSYNGGVPIAEYIVKCGIISSPGALQCSPIKLIQEG